VGEAYFIIDGHHRASVARELGYTNIEAYVRPVSISVPIQPDDDLQDLILKSEYADFLSKTGLDETHLQADLLGTLPEAYPFLLEQIKLHQHLINQKGKKDFDFKEAALNWYETVYLPVIKIIRNRNLMRKFSDRTEIDLYYWIMDYQFRREQELGWELNPRDAVENLTFYYSRTLADRLARFQKKLLNFLIPEPLEPPLPPGFWRQNRRTPEETQQSLFDTILVTLPESDQNWKVMLVALFLAKQDHAVINGLTIIKKDVPILSPRFEPLRERFQKICQKAGVEGRLALEHGKVTRVIYERSFWVDLTIVPLNHPAPIDFFHRWSSGTRTLIRRSASPVLFVPPDAPNEIHSILVAYGGGRLSDEALYMAAYLCIRFTMDLTVLSIGKDPQTTAPLIQRARKYLESMHFSKVTYIEEIGDPSQTILKISDDINCDAILMGGYESGVFKELLFGSTVDRVLNKTNRLVMICR
jgi:nucleotide-binding universal stress UspA family protein